MLRLKPRQREVLIEKWPDLANLALAGLVFGQFLSAEPFSLPVALGGLAIWSAVMLIVMTFAGDAP